MKSLLLVYENAAHEPLDVLDGRTPLQVARAPTAARLAAEGVCGVLARPPYGEGLRSEALLAGLMGVPRADAWRVARGPLEARALSADGATYTYAYRGELVTVDEGVIREARLAHLSRSETEQLVAAIQEELEDLPVRLLTGGEGHVAVLLQHDSTALDIGCAPWLLAPDDELAPPEGRRHKLVRAIMERAARVLARQTINDVRVDLGENPANALWLWGGGPRVELLEKFGGRPLRGVMVTSSAMARGLALSLGLAVEPMGDPGKAAQPAEVLSPAQLATLLKQYDIVTVYVEAPRELLLGPGSDGVRLLDRMDLTLTTPLLNAMKRIKHRRMVLATVPAAAEKAARARGPRLPVAVWGAHVIADGVQHWDETACAAGELGDVEPMDVFGRLVGG